MDFAAKYGVRLLCYTYKDLEEERYPVLTYGLPYRVVAHI
jgi:hypothetical protein